MPGTRGFHVHIKVHACPVTAIVLVHVNKCTVRSPVVVPTTVGDGLKGVDARKRVSWMSDANVSLPIENATLSCATIVEWKRYWILATNTETTCVKEDVATTDFNSTCHLVRSKA